MSTINIQDLVKEAMFNALDQQKRDELLKNALASLLKEPTSGYYGDRDKNTPLQKAFDEAAQSLCRRIVEEYMTGDSPEAVKMREGVRDVVVKGWEKFITQGDELSTKIASAIANQISRADR